jgi:hypothetical protein
MNERITPEWLISIGIYPSDAGKKHPNDPPTEFFARIVGGTDDGWKTSSDEDENGDEIADLVIAYEEDRESVSVWIEVYREPDLNTVAVVEIGSRYTRKEILDLCCELKAWDDWKGERFEIGTLPPPPSIR